MYTPTPELPPSPSAAAGQCVKETGPAARRPAARLLLWLTAGIYHPAVRERLGFTWTDRDERRLRLLGRAVRHGWRLVPFEYRFHPRARDAWRRARGRVPADAPLVETPARNLPPLPHRNDPRHYVPGR
ncbi:oxygenase MpaB family protein [Streptomyces specialis]|uniref:oxygenase MpaB family protein n=1 Tax=Streptomyces specialis TaxID=498367 RepID=UPI00073E6388|nr:oxygenase MpaB family protein [Streptomyces specialis]